MGTITHSLFYYLYTTRALALTIDEFNSHTHVAYQETDSLVEKLQDEGTYVSKIPATSHYMQLEEENSP